MADNRSDEAREILEEILPDMKLDGLSLNQVTFDFYTESVDATFAWNGQKTRIRLTLERLNELRDGRMFAAKRLRDQLHKELGAEEE